jgi:hypothetical protein
MLQLCLLILLFIYLLSAFGCWLYVHIGHGNNGYWKNTSPSGTDVFVTFCPLLNTLGVFIWVMQSPFTGEDYAYERLWRKLFGLK